MRLIDERFKDASPKDTIAKIQTILKENGIQVVFRETDTGVANCYSLHLTVDGSPGMCSNGKGVTKELAHASAHGEFMERLQGGWLTRESPPFGDTRHFNRAELEEHCGPWLREFLQDAVENEELPVTYEKLVQACFDTCDSSDTVEVIPVLNAMTGEYSYLPPHLLRNICSTNGLAAGNSLEEAFVQGFSEIVERNFERTFFSGKAVPPTIPEDYLAQFTTAYETINDIRSHGYDVFVKDCSLGLGFPMIAVVVVDKKSHRYRVHVGSCPVFEIALQRCITEMFQNRYLTQIFSENTIFQSTGSRSVSDKNRLYVRGEGAFPLDFFVGTPSYPFVPYADLSQKTNKDLVHWIIDFVKRLGKTILLRDMSHLGFPTVQLFIPGFSGVHYSDYSNTLPLSHMRVNAEKCASDLTEATPDQLLEFMLFCKYRISYMQTTMRRPKLTFSSLLDDVGLNLPVAMDVAYGMLSVAYADWACGNRDVKQYISMAMSGMEGENEAYLSCLRHVFTRENKSVTPEAYLEQLSFLYEPHIIEQVRQALMPGSNPFSRFVIRCKKENCATCPFAPYCTKSKVTEVREMLYERVRNYDNDAAFAALKNMI